VQPPSFEMAIESFVDKVNYADQLRDKWDPEYRNRKTGADFVNVWPFRLEILIPRRMKKIRSRKNRQKFLSKILDKIIGVLIFIKLCLAPIKFWPQSCVWNRFIKSTSLANCTITKARRTLCMYCCDCDLKVQIKCFVEKSVLLHLYALEY
jgi:hypothetical protein